jgi:hypothetical protein
MVRVKTGIADPLKEWVARVVGGKKVLFGLLRQSTHDPQAMAIVDAIEEARLSLGHRLSGLTGSDDIPLDLILDHAHMTPRDLVGIACRCGWDFNQEIGKQIFAMYYPAMMETSMKRALDPDATREREIHFKASGHLPTSKGIQIAVQQNNNADHDPDPGEAPSVGHTSRRVVRDLPPVR